MLAFSFLLFVGAICTLCVARYLDPSRWSQLSLGAVGLTFLGLGTFLGVIGIARWLWLVAP